MSTRPVNLSETQLDAALDRLQAPPPSDILVERVRRMAPPRPVAVASAPWWGRSGKVAAVLVAAIAVAALMQSGAFRGVSSEAPAVAVADPAGEIPVPQLSLTGDGPAAVDQPQEPISVAGIPLE